MIAKIYTIEFDNNCNGTVSLGTWDIIQITEDTNVYNIEKCYHYQYSYKGKTKSATISEKGNTKVFLNRDEAIEELLTYHKSGVYRLLNTELIEKYPEYMI